MSTPGLGPHDRFHEYTDFTTFVLADASCEAVAAALGNARCRVRGGQLVAPHDDRSHLGLVIEIAGRPWRSIELEEDHDGVPIAFEIGDDKFHVPFEALSEFEEVWSVRLRDADLDLAPWADIAAQFG